MNSWLSRFIISQPQVAISTGSWLADKKNTRPASRQFISQERA
jgi:hypothetical protein